MLYFAYGSNLNHAQMKETRCMESQYLNATFLENYKLSFCHPNKANKYGYANVIRKKGFKVPGAIWEITKEHEKILDEYEGFPNTYQKEYFNFNVKKIMFYIMKKYFIKEPPKSYVNIILEGYKDCKLEESYLKNALREVYS